MRTPQQIDNLRRVMAVMYGPLVAFLPDSDIDNFANNLENHFQYHWTVKVRIKENATTPWPLIKAEPPSPRYSFAEIKKMCVNLLIKYDKILEMQVSLPDSLGDVYVITRKDIPNE